MANAKLCTFINIFGETFEYEVIDKKKKQIKSVTLEKILVPKIQRDYAQGRQNVDINRIRERFLDALLEAVDDKNDKTITLDFIYGDIEDKGDDKGVMTPLDGQQRLTTLFLLHWYAAKKAKLNCDDDEYKFLENFSYATRPSAREFCKHLVEEFNPTFETKSECDASEPQSSTETDKYTLSSEIEDQAWFPLYWKHDSTIKSMLVMLDVIDEKFSKVKNLWSQLKDGKVISFYVLPIKDMGLTDDLYIKMNSRGKPLTMFEHFKAELEHELNEVDSNMATKIISKFDIDWTNLLWNPKEPKIVDNKLLRCFRFICDILRYHQNKPVGKSNDEFSLIAELFSLKKVTDTKSEQNIEEAIENRKSEIRNNVKFLEDYFDCWIEIKKTEPIAEFFGKYISKEGHAEGKIISDGKVNYFEYCLEKYVEMKDKDSGQQFNLGDSVRGSNAGFSLSDIIIFYTFVKYAINNYITNENKIEDKDFRRRLRIIQNLVKNSSDDLREDSMPAILKQVDDILLKGELIPADTTGRRLNAEQFIEEQKKLEWTKKHPDLSERLFELEDHHLLYGQVDILSNQDKTGVPIEYLNADYFDKFKSLFKCDYDLIDCALMSIGDYKQHYRNLYQTGTSGINHNVGDNSWKSLFHHSASEGFENTRNCLQKLLSSLKVNITNDDLKQIIKKYTDLCEKEHKFDWRYYYVKYPDFRPKRYGKYYWNDFKNRPYEFTVLWTSERTSWNAYNPFLKSVEDDKFQISREDFGLYIKFDDKYIACENSAYVIKSSDRINVIDTIGIDQDSQGIDTEDRIKKFLKNKDKL